MHRKMVAATTPMDLFIQEFRPATDSGEYVCTVTDLSTGARVSTPAASLNVLSEFSLRLLSPPLPVNKSPINKKPSGPR